MEEAIWEASGETDMSDWDYHDGDDEDGPEPGEECGRWDNGRLTHSCSKAGSEECPYRDTLKF